MVSDPGGALADLPDHLRKQFLQWKADQGLATDSQALIALMEFFFSNPQAHSTSLPQTLSSPSDLNPLQAQIQNLEQEITQLKEIIQLGRGIINQRMDALDHRISTLETRSGPPSPDLPFDDAELPDDEPDEILTDFLEPR